jgi:hypothetical protein
MEIEKLVVRFSTDVFESQMLPAVDGSLWLSRGIEEMCKEPTEEEVPPLLQMLCAGIIAAFNGMHHYIDGARWLCGNQQAEKSRVRQCDSCVRLDMTITTLCLLILRADPDCRDTLLRVHRAKAVCQYCTVW